MSVSRPRRWLGLALPLGLWLLVAACGVTPASPAPLPAPTVAVPLIPLAVLQTDPAAVLTMPGTDLLDTGPGMNDVRPFRGGYEPARIVHRFGTQASSQAVFAYYDQALVAVGYRFFPNIAILGSSESDTWVWCKPLATLRLSILIQDRAFDPALLQGRMYTTVFMTFLTGRDNSPCPTPQGSSAPSQQP